MIAIIIADFPC